MIETKRIILVNRETTEGKQSLTTTYDAAFFTSIKFGELRVSLHAQDGNPFLGDFLPVDWRLTSITVNGKRFTPSDRLNSVNKIHESGGSSYQKDTLIAGQLNNFTVAWNAPLGAGVVSPHASITMELFVIGDNIPFTENLGTINPANIAGAISDIGKRATLPTILIGIALLVGLGLVAYILTRSGPVIETTENLVEKVEENI